MISLWDCTVLKGLVWSIARLFEKDPVAAQAEIADMGEISRGPSSVRNNHAAGNGQINLFIDGKWGLGVFHSIPL